MFRLERIFKDYEDSGALNAHVGLYGFWDEEIVLTKAGDLGTVIRVEGVDYECLDSGARDYVVKRLESAFRLFDPRFRFYQAIFKRNRPEIPWPEHSNAVVQTAIDNRRRLFERKADALYELDIHFAIFFEGFRHRTGLLHGLKTAAASPERGIRELKALYAQRGQTTLIRDEIEHAAEILRNRVRLFLQNVADFLPSRIVPGAESFRVLHRFLNPDRLRREAAVLADGRFLDFQLCDSDIEAHRDHLRVGDQFVRVLTLKQPPAQTFPLILKELLEVKANFHVVSEWRQEAPERTRKQIQSRRRHFHNSKTSLLSQLNTAEQKYQPDLLVDDSKEALIAELGQSMTAIEMEGRQFGEYSLTVVVYDKAPAAVQRAEGELIKAFSRHDGVLHAERYNLLNAFFAAVPGNRPFNLRRFYLTDANHADLSFVFTIGNGERTNVHLRREYLAVLETQQATPYFFNLHHADIGHTFMVGKSGAGKSFALNFLIQSLQKYDPYTFIFDLGGGFRAVTETHGGSHLEIGYRALEGRRVTINPFCLPPEADNLHFVYSLMKLLIEGNGAAVAPGSESHRSAMAPSEERELFQAIIEGVYSLPEASRTLSSLARIVPRALGERLRKWTQAGPYGFVFDNPEDTLTLNRFQCFNFEGMDAYPEVLEPLLFYVLHRANRALAEPAAATVFKAFVMDEAWLFFRNATARAYIVEALKTWRKKNAALILATQSLDELRKSDILDVVIESCSTKLFLANPDLDPELYRRAFHLNDTEIAAIADLVPKRQLLMKRPNLAKVLNLEVDPESYWLYTNDPFDNDRRAQAFERHGAEEGLKVLAGKPAA